MPVWEKGESFMEKPSFKDRFRYWFDNRMAKGSLALIRLLAIATIAVILLIAILIVAFGFNEDGDAASSLWDSFATVINAWMPYYEDGNAGYLVLMSIGAVFGILFTSVLIGIFSTAIEDKIDSLKKGNSRVLESGHYVILGHKSGDHTLLRQLVMAAGDRPRCIVIASDIAKDEMEEDIKDNLEIPKKVKIICRSIDISNPAELEKCSIATCKSVIISPMDDLSTTKTLLAVTGIIRNNPESKARVAAIVSDERYRLPQNIADRLNVSLFRTREILARIIAHSCTQVCLSQVFEQIFNFEGSEMYIVDFPGIEGKTFLELSSCVDNGALLGIYKRNGDIVLSPDPEYIVANGDMAIVFAENEESVKAADPVDISKVASDSFRNISPKNEGKTVIIGSNEVIDLIINELPDNTEEIVLSNISEEEAENVKSRVKSEKRAKITYSDLDAWDEDALLNLVREASHAVILNDHGADTDESDMHCIMLVLKLRDLRERYSLKYNITAEINDERNENLISFGSDSTDYIVTSNMISLFLAQLAENPKLYHIFKEILSNEGNEIYLKTAEEMQCAGEYNCAELRAICLYHGYVFLGINKIRGTESLNLFNPRLEETIKLEPADRLIVMGDN